MVVPVLGAFEVVFGAFEVGAKVVNVPFFKTAKAGEKLTPQSFGFMAILTYPSSPQWVDQEFLIIQ